MNIWKTILNRSSRIGIIILLLWPLPLLASLPPIEKISIRQQTTTNLSQLTTIAKQWGLSITEYQRYQQLMQLAPNQHWYQTLDPAEVLALNSDNKTAMEHYARIQAKNTHQRVLRELLFNQLYAQAYHALYPNEQAIEDLSHANTLHWHRGDRLWLFVDSHYRLAESRYHQLLTTVQQNGAVLDIYLVGKKITPLTIQHWAIVNHIVDTAMNRSVTLNSGNVRWAAINRQHRYALPLLAWVHDQQLQPIQWRSLDEKK